MVGGEHHSHPLGVDLREEEGEEVVEIAVEAVEHVLDLHRLGAVGLGDAARGVEADIHQVSLLVASQAHLGDRLLGQPQHGGVARGGVEQPLVVVPKVEARGHRALLAPGALGGGDVAPAVVAVAVAVEQRAPLRGHVGAVVALAVAALDPLGQRGVAPRGGPAAVRRVEPQGRAAAPGHHHGRRGLGGDRHGLAARQVLQERLGQRGGDQVVGARALPPGDQLHGAVVDVVAPARAHHAVHRGLGPRGEGGQRDGGEGLLVVVAGVGVDRAPFREAAEAPLAELSGVAVEVLGAHRADDDLHDQSGAGRGGGRRSEEQGEEQYAVAFHGVSDG